MLLDPSRDSLLIFSGNYDVEEEVDEIKYEKSSETSSVIKSNE